MTFFPTDQPFFDLHSGIAALIADASIETQLNNNIRVYGDSETIKEIAQLVVKYASIWEFEGFVRILPEH